MKKSKKKYLKHLKIYRKQLKTRIKASKKLIKLEYKDMFVSKSRLADANKEIKKK